MILLPLMLVSAGAGAFVAYSQYETIAAMMGHEVATEPEVEMIEYGEFMELSNIIVNPSGGDGRRLLMLSLGIETAEPAVLETLGAREIVVRDTIIRLMGRRTVEELAKIEDRDVIKDELKTALNGIIQEGEINRMYFTQYVLQ